MEGSECRSDEGCDSTGLLLPILEYEHDGPCAVIGGPVYRGTALPFVGETFYADFCEGWIKSFLYDGSAVTLRRVWTTTPDRRIGNITSFGQDSRGEVYVLTEGDGIVYKMVPRVP